MLFNNTYFSSTNSTAASDRLPAHNLEPASKVIPPPLYPTNIGSNHSSFLYSASPFNKYTPAPSCIVNFTLFNIFISLVITYE
jgi:hypothetical protein